MDDNQKKDDKSFQFSIDQSVVAVIKELTRAVDGLCEASHTTKSMFYDAQKRHEDLMHEITSSNQTALREISEANKTISADSQKRHEDLMHEITNDHKLLTKEAERNHKEEMENQEKRAAQTERNHKETAEQVEKNHKEEMESQEKRARWLHIVSIAAIIASLIFGAYWSARLLGVSIQKTKMSGLYMTAHALENEINKRVSKEDRLMVAMSNLRGMRDDGQSQCKNGKYTGSDSAVYRKELFRAGYQLTAATYEVMSSFDEATIKKIRIFLANASVDGVGICAKGATDDATLEAEQTDVYKLMSKSIDQLRQERNIVMAHIERVEQE